MSKSELITKIAKDMLDKGMLNEQNYNFDADALLNDVKNTIMMHLENYTIISGSILE